MTWTCHDCGGETEGHCCQFCGLLAERPRGRETGGPETPRPEVTPEQWAHGLRVSRFLTTLRYLATGASPEAITTQRARLLAFMADMERDYPGTGWAEAKAECATFFARAAGTRPERRRVEGE